MPVKSHDVVLYRGMTSEDNSGEIVISRYESWGIEPVTRPRECTELANTIYRYPQA